MKTHLWSQLRVGLLIGVGTAFLLTTVYNYYTELGKIITPYTISVSLFLLLILTFELIHRNKNSIPDSNLNRNEIKVMLNLLSALKNTNDNEYLNLTTIKPDLTVVRAMANIALENGLADGKIFPYEDTDSDIFVEKITEKGLSYLKKPFPIKKFD